MLGSLAGGCDGSSPGSPSVLLITADTTRVDDLEVYGGSARTPHLRALREDGVLFGQAYSVAFGTTPSHASLFASTYARDHGVYNNKTILDEATVTMAEIAAAAGIETAAFVSSAAVGDRRLGLAQGFAAFDHANSGQRRADRTVDRFVAWLRGVKGPFLAWIHFVDPHAPYAPPTRFGKHYLTNENDLSAAYSDRFRRLLKTKKLLEMGPAVFDRGDRIARGLYRGEIEFMDEQLGRAIGALKRRGLYDETAIVFISDHGENFGKPDPLMAFGHGRLHKHVTHLPLIFKLPLSRWAGEQRDFLVANIDVAPTLLDLLGLEGDASWRGRSLLPALDGKQSGVRDHVVLESAHEIEISVRTSRWVYRRRLTNRGGYPHLPPLQLYDLASDPGEIRNIYGSSETEASAATELLERISREFLAKGRQAPHDILETKEHIDALRELGYAE